uniref:Uncharacterized protein n=1 Tax=Arundo donax TaxID=35708 RepID=A0A0A9BCD3_ARUDO
MRRKLLRFLGLPWLVRFGS